MPKLKTDKLTLKQLAELSTEERAKALEPIVKANQAQFTKLAEAISNATNIGKAFTELARFPTYDLLESIKLPQLPDATRYLDNDAYVLGRIEPHVTITKSEEEIEREAKLAYLTELHIKLLEQQLNLVKSVQTPQYEINTGIITFMGKQIEIPLNTNMEMVCRIVLKNAANMKRKWSWDTIVEENRENIDAFTSRKIYTAVRSINEKVAQETAVKDFLLAKPLSTVQLNPIFLAK